MIIADLQLWRPDPDDPLIGRVSDAPDGLTTSFVVLPGKKYLAVRIPLPLKHGDNEDVKVETRFPGVDYSELKPGVTFLMMEGWRQIGIGTVKG